MNAQHNNLEIISVFKSGRETGGYNDDGWELSWCDGHFFYRSWAGAAVSGMTKTEHGTVYHVPSKFGPESISYDDALALTSNIPFQNCKDFFAIRDWKKILENNDIHAHGVDQKLIDFVDECIKLHGPDTIRALSYKQYSLTNS